MENFLVKTSVKVSATVLSKNVYVTSKLEAMIVQLYAIHLATIAVENHQMIALHAKIMILQKLMVLVWNVKLQGALLVRRVKQTSVRLVKVVTNLMMEILVMPAR